MERKTKIVCTIGPATSSEERLRSLIEAGMNVARLNFSHGDHSGHGLVIERIRALSDELGQPIAILQDLAGPKVRIGMFAADSIELQEDDSFTLTTRRVQGTQKEVTVSYLSLPREVNAGDRLLLADGSLELIVERVTETEIHCRVVNGGRLSSKKGVNVPSGLFGLPILRDKDLSDLRFGLEQGVDYVGLSFVRTAQDLIVAKQEMEKLGRSAPLIAKIETKAALKNFDEILEEADGIMIARGDLSIETPFSQVPVLQKQLIARANEAAKPSITATQMLWSMVDRPRPTRAEVADVANAVMDGSDAVMLSEETTIGRYPLEAVRTMASVAAETEKAGFDPGWKQDHVEKKRPSQEEEVARAGCQLARRLDVGFLGTITSSGETARFAAKYRPSQPILAVTQRVKTYRSLALVRGVTPLLLKGEQGNFERIVEAAVKIVSKRGWQDSEGVFISRDRVRVGRL
jgi:pyruvate kinase